MDKYLCLAPEGFALDFTQNPFTPKYNKKRPKLILNNFAYLIHIVAYKSLKGNKNYCILNAKILQRLVKDYRQYLEYLERIGFIHISKSYKKGEISKTYSLTLKWSLKKLTIFHELTDRNILKRISNIFYKSVEVSEFNIYPKLKGWFNSNLTFDFDRADNILNNLDISNKLKVCKEYHLNKLGVALSSNRLSIGKTGRLYTPVSNLKSELRASLRYNNLPLAEIDISNSLPFIFDNILYIKEIEDIRLKIINKYIDIDIWIIYVNQILNNEDIKLYSDLIRSGGFYKFLAELWSINQNAAISITSAKIKFNSIINQIVYTRDSREKTVLRKQFPNLIAFVDFIYKNRKDRVKKNPLPLILQAIEAEFVLNKVVPHLSNNFPNVPIFTLHDCIITTHNKINIITNAFETKGLEFFGEAPKYKIKDHSIEAV
jgi:hypothetical protein